MGVPDNSPRKENGLVPGGCSNMFVLEDPDDYKLCIWEMTGDLRPGSMLAN